MDYIQSIQAAIEFMEGHLLDEIGYEDAARHVSMSSYHFHRIFSMIAGMTAGEYIRSRRLSMAGQELAASSPKVIDIALKYGYETPESFAKAFTRFHGVTPSQARHPGCKLRLFHRLAIQIHLEGGTIMEYRIEEREKFKLLAKVQAFRNEITSEDGNTEIPDFWQECERQGVLDVLKAHTCKHDIYGVCAPISKESTHFDYGIGMEYSGGPVPDGYRIWEVTPTLWAVFPCMGTDGSCMGPVWERIFKEFLPGCAYHMLDDTDFELYSGFNNPGCFCEIWIPVEKKRDA